MALVGLVLTLCTLYFHFHSQGNHYDELRKESEFTVCVSILIPFTMFIRLAKVKDVGKLLILKPDDVEDTFI